MKIIEAVNQVTEIPILDIMCSEVKKNEVVHARYLCFFFEYAFTEKRMTDIVKEYDVCNHTVVRRGIREIMLRWQKKFAYHKRNTINDIEQIRDLLGIHKAIGRIIEFTDEVRPFGICVRKEEDLFLSRNFYTPEEALYFQKLFYLDKRELRKTTGNPYDESWSYEYQFTIV